VNVSLYAWAATIGFFVAVLIVDLVVVDRRPHAFTTKEAARWVTFYVFAAIVFAGIVWQVYGGQYAGEFVAGYITEYSLSIDNLFVFLVIMTSFAVPAAERHRVLLVGIVIALVLRGIMIAVGAAVIERFSGAFYVFGAFLLWTAWHVAKSGDDEPNPEGNGLVRFVERRVPTTKDYHGHKLTVVLQNKRYVTPMLLVMLAIGTTDLLFALDSIPAVFGLTEEPFIVFAANAFALMGLRQLYFLLSGLADKVIYLTYGLAVILGFIGVKLILEAVEKTTDLHPPHINTWVSLGVIVGVLVITTLASVIAVRRNPELAKKAHGGALGGEHEGEALTDVPDDAPHAGSTTDATADSTTDSTKS
jgi:tellurite resistance protein TerC